MIVRPLKTMKMIPVIVEHKTSKSEWSKKKPPDLKKIIQLLFNKYDDKTLEYFNIFEIYTIFWVYWNAKTEEKKEIASSNESSKDKRLKARNVTEAEKKLSKYYLWKS